MSDKKELIPITTTNTWNENIEKVIKQIGDACQGYKWINMYVAEKYTSIHNYLMYVLMILGPVVGILGTISLGEESKVIQNFITVLSFMMGIITAFIKFSKLEQKSLTHKTFSAKYESLEGNIRRQLSLYRKERVNAGEYLEWISKSYDDLFSTGPLISTDMYAKWYEYAEKNGITVPPSMNKIIDIKVNIDELPFSRDVQEKENQENKENKENKENVGIIESNITVEKPSKKVKTSTSSFQDMSFDDENMRYQMRRLFNRSDGTLRDVEKREKRENEI